jgi:trimeric autotransporter adhesin
MNVQKLSIPLFIVMAILPGLLAGQQTVTSSAVVPRLVNFSGRAIDALGKPISGIAGVTFSIYKDQYEGAPLWMETQNVQADAKGNYVAQLGATTSDGLPLELFASGDARWLGVRVNGGEERPRVLLMSVPYALKAADAQTLGGLPPSAFALAVPVGSSAANAAGGMGASPAASASPLATSDVTTTGGTVNALPLWTTSTNVQSSALTQTGTGAAAKIGIGTATPATTVDVAGAATIRGALTLPAIAYATATAGKNSQPENLVASSFNSTTSAAVNQTFQWRAEATGNNTAAPSSVLSLLSGSGTSAPAETGLKIAHNGQITFAPGQTFPEGSGSVTSVGLSAPASDFTVSGSPVTTAGTLGLKWKVAPTNTSTANAIVKRDATGSFNAGAITASFGVTGMNAGGGVGGVTGENSSAGYGVLGTATGTAGQGVWGESFGTLSNTDGTGPDGVHGVSHSNLGSGVAGINTVSGGTGTYGQGIAYGVLGQAAGNGLLLPLGTGVGGSSFAGTGVEGTSSGGAGVSGTSDSGPGVSGTSTTGNAFVANGNVSQNRAGGGWVKAMAFVNALQAPYSIIGCFNSALTGAAATTPPCGINFTEDAQGIGYWDFDLGFEVHDRFVSASISATLVSDGAVMIQASPQYWRDPTTVVKVLTYKGDLTGAGAMFYLFVY